MAGAEGRQNRGRKVEAIFIFIAGSVEVRFRCDGLHYLRADLLPLRILFAGMWFITNHKDGANALSLKCFTLVWGVIKRTGRGYQVEASNDPFRCGINFVVAMLKWTNVRWRQRDRR